MPTHSEVSKWNVIFPISTVILTTVKVEQFKEICSQNWNPATQMPWVLLVGGREELRENILLIH